jgi:hypothetical protein
MGSEEDEIPFLAKVILKRLEWEERYFDVLGSWIEAWAEEHNTVELLLGGSPDFFNSLDDKGEK